MTVKIADFIEAPNSGGNYMKNLLVVHVTVSPETTGAARGIVAYWNRARSGSTQYVVDNREIIQGVRETAYAWAAGTTANKRGIHVEHCGFIQSVREWRDGYSTAELELSAPLFAELAQKYGIPIRRLTVEQIRHAAATGKASDGGICGHSDITKAFPGETTHTDPGVNFPWDTFMGLIKAAAAPKPAPVVPVTPRPAPVPTAPADQPAERLAADWSYARPNPVAVKAAGIRGAIRYLSTTPAKNISVAEAGAIHAAGLWISLVWERSKGRAADGRAAGVTDVKMAEAQADALGYPKTAAIWYTVDFDADPAAVMSYFQGVKATAKRPVGVYGSARVVEAVKAAGLAKYAWQTVAWSGGRVSKVANWFQRNTHSVAIEGSKPTDWDEDLLIGGNVPVWRS